MMNRRKFLNVAAATTALAWGGGLLSACATGDPLPGPVPKIGFSHMAPLSLSVSRVDVASDFKAPLAPPHVEHRMPTAPEQALMDWAKARLKARGGANVPANGLFVVEDASVVEVPLETAKGFKGIVTTEPTERYEAQVKARLTIEDPGRGGGTVRARARRTIEIQEDATLAQRETKWVELVENVMADFDAEMEKQMRQYLQRWLMP